MIDLTGQKFGRLTAIYSVSGPNGRLWYCKCDCGKMKEKPLSGYELKTKKRNHCGCIKQKNGMYKHGQSDTKLYKVWSAMKARCRNPNDKAYQNYGGRGITYCNDWEDFETFYEWAMESGYKEELTLERIDNNGNYEPSNCTWIPKSEQTNNRRINKDITYKGQTRNMKEWANELGFDYHVIQSRISKLGWSVEKAFETPVAKSKKKPLKYISYGGKTQDIAKWARDLGVEYMPLYRHLHSGKAIEEFIEKSPRTDDKRD